jgi:hypothetical protein
MSGGSRRNGSATNDPQASASGVARIGLFRSISLVGADGRVPLNETCLAAAAVTEV